MTERTDPVVIELNCEANPSTDTVEIDRARWNDMTPTERAVMLDDMTDEHIGNAGGGGWYIADTDDEASVGTVPTTYPVDVDAAMRLVVRYGVECRQNGPLTDTAEQLLTRIRTAITGKEA
ncbi:hypothetical protein AB0I89_24010 [Micromonospora sp. NPDC049801]|uniref:DUF7167 family protein n=1 Tax=unclassified Micromonospora TaxID=2617518 RepID=UPI0033D76495